jgi:hypothetical protein
MPRRLFLAKALAALAVVPAFSGCGDEPAAPASDPPAATGIPANRGPAATPKQKKK